MKPASWILMERAWMADHIESSLLIEPKAFDPDEWPMVLFCMRECEKPGYLRVRHIKKIDGYQAMITDSGKRALRRWRAFQADEVAKRFMEEWANARQE